MSPMPIVFTVLGASGLGVAIYALWRSLRAAFGVAGLDEVRGNSVTETRSILLERKAALLSSIQEARFELDGGKLSEEDWKALDGSLRAKAKVVLRALDDDVEPFIEDAEALISEHLGKKGSPYRDAKSAEPTEKADSEEKSSADSDQKSSDENDSIECPKCGTQNDHDATFCKSCAAELPTKAAAEAEEKRS